MGETNRIILIDADIVSHFITAGEIIMLSSIFKNNIYILDKVYAELQRFPKRKKDVDNILKDELLIMMDFPHENDEIIKEYYFLKKYRLKGDGESACMAVARYNKNILASSNLKDINEYCKMHNIDYLTTMDFLCEALKTELFTIERCNDFIKKVLSAGSKLPVKSMDEYKCKDISFVE